MTALSPKKEAGRGIKFTVLYEEQEQDMLEQFAKAEDRSAVAFGERGGARAFSYGCEIRVGSV
jgi:hypothetical protein